MISKHLGHNEHQGVLQRLPECTLVVEGQERNKETKGSISSLLHFHNVQMSYGNMSFHLQTELAADFIRDKN